MPLCLIVDCHGPGTLMELGISPIITSSMIMQVDYKQLLVCSI